MQIIRKLFIGTMTVAGVAACIAAAILIARHGGDESLDEPEARRAVAWENLGSSFDAGLPTVPVEAPGLAHIADPNLANSALTRDVIDEELPDASSEEREIWRTELAQRSPAEIREIMGIHRRLSPTAGHTQVGDVEFAASDIPAPQPLPAATIAAANRIATDAPTATSPRADGDAAVSADALKLIESAIEADRSAEQVILNNIANAHSIGFKRSRALFGDLPHRHVDSAGHDYVREKAAPDEIAPGAGVCLTAMQADHSQGRLRHTERSLDIAIQGEGYFQINDGARTLYTRRGSFGLNAAGEIVLISRDRSRPIGPTIKVSPETTKIVISPSGSVSALAAGPVQLVPIGQLSLCRFTNPEALVPKGEGLFEATEACGNPTVAAPGQSGLGEVRQGALEESNVVTADEMSELRRLREHQKTLQQLQAELGGSDAAP